jgi:hypothetical protein
VLSFQKISPLGPKRSRIAEPKMRHVHIKTSKKKVFFFFSSSNSSIRPMENSGFCVLHIIEAYEEVKLWEGYQPSSKPPNLNSPDFLSGVTPLCGLTLPHLKSLSPRPLTVLGHSFSGSSARACPIRVGLPGGYTPAVISPDFIEHAN